MSSITKVALAGATGNLGPAILNQLVSAGFEVTVLTRNAGPHSFPRSVSVVSVNYDSLDSLFNALRGQEAVVSTLASAALATQVLLVKAAAKAGVKRFIPSEFGSNTLNEKNRGLPVFADKIKVQDTLKKNATSNGMTYSLIYNGPFLDWGIMVGFIMNLKAKSITLFDGGNRLFSTTSLPTIAKAVTGVLTHLEETKNRAVYVQDTATTLKTLAAMGEKATGGNWEQSVVAVDEMLEQAWAELKKDKPNPEVFVFNFLKTSIWGEGHGGHFENLDNELLGLKQMSDVEIQKLVSSFAE